MTLYIRNYDTFLNIKNGKKKIEIRLAYGFILTVKPGDVLTLQCRTSKLSIIITKITYYNLFNHLLNNIMINHIFPDINETDKDKAIIRFNSYYPTSKLDRYPIVALHLNVI